MPELYKNLEIFKYGMPSSQDRSFERMIEHQKLIKWLRTDLDMPRQANVHDGV